MIKLEELGKSHMPCRFCDGTGLNDWSIDKRVTLFGMSTEEIMTMWKFAQEHGYKAREMKCPYCHKEAPYGECCCGTLKDERGCPNGH